MPHYTRLTKSEVASISAAFNIPSVSSFELLSGGSENTNYLITSISGKYVLSLCEQKSVQQAKELAHLLTHLEENNFNSSKIVYTTTNESVIVWEGKPVIVKQFIEGKIQKNLSPDVLQLIGKELAKLHQIPTPNYLPKQLNYGKEQFAQVKNYAANSEFEHWLNGIQEYMAPYFKLDIPHSFIHSDLFWNNVIVNEATNEVVIIDFEESAYYYRLFDIGMMIIGIAGETETINLEKARQLLAGYQSETQLQEQELQALKAFTIYAGASMTFWRHQNFNYTKPDPQMFDHYLGLKVLVDFMMAQEEDCFS